MTQRKEKENELENGDQRDADEETQIPANLGENIQDGLLVELLDDPNPASNRDSQKLACLAAVVVVISQHFLDDAVVFEGTRLFDQFLHLERHVVRG